MRNISKQPPRCRGGLHVLWMVSESGVAGVNLWGWGGYAEPAHRAWEPGDDYTGDPAQEDQGLNSVFATDKSTLEIIREAASRVRK